VIEYFDTERGRFAVEITGPAEAPPAVLIAGLGDDHASWEPVLPYLTPEYRCVTFDNRGIGLSPITPGPTGYPSWPPTRTRSTGRWGWSRAS
jgi:pimeloyl-ACP methyl ester carboxylesterase